MPVYIRMHMHADIYVGTHVHVHTNEALVLSLVCISRMQSVFY